jgi:hypothetical protein
VRFRLPPSSTAWSDSVQPEFSGASLAMTDRSASSHSGSESISSPSMSNNTATAGPVPSPGGYGGAGSPSPGGYGGAGSPPVIRGGLGGIVPPRLTDLLIGVILGVWGKESPDRAGHAGQSPNEQG